jgi:hypothetical protein
MPARFVQIISHSATLYALDETGEVWSFGGDKWHAVTDRRGLNNLEIRTKAATGGYRPGN